mmetsp:Transcript_27017/g.68705  ORF Transcript_27017/g.68705 Transcript_27017/m.68705 type:complete len:212 (-) Transcript_27017:416-1051(-)
MCRINVSSTSRGDCYCRRVELGRPRQAADSEPFFFATANHQDARQEGNVKDGEVRQNSSLKVGLRSQLGFSLRKTTPPGCNLLVGSRPSCRALCHSHTPLIGKLCSPKSHSERLRKLQRMALSLRQNHLPHRWQCSLRQQRKLRLRRACPYQAHGQRRDPRSARMDSTIVLGAMTPMACTTFAMIARLPQSRSLQAPCGVYPQTPRAIRAS